VQPNAVEDVETGSIILWSGAIVDIPAGYVLCDGNNGTPDLRDKFVPGAGGAYAVGSAGGSNTHGHTDNFSVQDSTSEQVIASGSGAAAPETPHGHGLDGAVIAADGRPPYYSLAYIMKT